MRCQLDKKSFVQPIALALLFAWASTPELLAEPSLTAQYARAQGPGPAGMPVPPGSYACETTGHKQNNSLPKSSVQQDSVLATLERMTFPGYSDQALSVIEPQKTGNSLKAKANSNSEVQQRPTSDPSVFDLVSEFGCTISGQRIFAADQSQIVATIYKFTTSEGAYGAYCCLRKGASNLIVKGDASSEDDKTISFWKDKYFVNISETLSEDTESKTIVRKMADQLVAAIPYTSARPRILMRLPTLEKVLGSERIVLGPLALKKLFPAPFIGALGATTVNGAIADYQVQEPYRARLKLLVLQFPNQASASLSFTKYISELKEQHDELVIITGGRKKSSLPALANEIY